MQLGIVPENFYYGFIMFFCAMTLLSLRPTGYYAIKCLHHALILYELWGWGILIREDVTLHAVLAGKYFDSVVSG